jgi:adenosylcobinamide kinase/adenosylcobinamide-phosphate guanylyltransferase
VLLADAVRGTAVAGNAVLVDCLTLWLANLMEAELDVGNETATLIAALRVATGPVVIVSNEVGSGIVPDNALARRYSDAHGVLNQKIAAAVGRVVLMTAGLPLQLKPMTRGNIRL